MLPQLTAAVLLAQGCYQGFSQKGVQPSHGHPFLEEIQRKFTLSLIILWENMPSGWPVFNIWLIAWMLHEAPAPASVVTWIDEALVSENILKCKPALWTPT